MKRQAFTLLEVVVALGLFSVGIISLLQILPVNNRFLLQSNQNTKAVFLAQSELEIAGQQEYATLTTGTTPAYVPTASVSGTAFSRQVVAEYVNPSSTPAYQVTTTDTGLKRVTVSITWMERTISRSYVLSGYVAKP